MATRRVILPALSFIPLDGTANNLPAELDMVQSTGGPPGPRYTRWRFPSTPDNSYSVCVSFRLPDNYVSGGTFKFDWSGTTAGGGVSVHFDVHGIAVDDGDDISTAGGTAGSGTAYTVTGQVLDQDVATPHMDGAGAGDLFTLMFTRVNGASSPYPHDVLLYGGVFEYEAG